MKQLSTICGAVKHAQYLEHRCDTSGLTDCIQLIEQLMDIFDAIQNMGERMEDRLRDYRNFSDELQDKLNDLRRTK